MNFFPLPSWLPFLRPSVPFLVVQKRRVRSKDGAKAGNVFSFVRSSLLSYFFDGWLQSLIMRRRRKENVGEFFLLQKKERIIVGTHSRFYHPRMLAKPFHFSPLSVTFLPILDADLLVWRRPRFFSLSPRRLLRKGGERRPSLSSSSVNPRDGGGGGEIPFSSPSSSRRPPTKREEEDEALFGRWLGSCSLLLLLLLLLLLRPSASSSQPGLCFA